MTLQDKINLVDRAIKNSEYLNLSDKIYNIDGLTSPRSQTFLNLLTIESKILEIGSFCGASTVAMAKNAKHITTIDNWQDVEVISVDKKYINSINNPKEVFIKNTKRYDNIVSIDGDIFSEVIFTKLITKKFDIIFYDGPHEIIDIYKFFMLYEDLFEEIILVIDDYNFDSVKEGIELGLSSISNQPIKQWLIETEGESKETFWNGLAIFIFE